MSDLAYHLRVNKYIDRQLFMESLQLINRTRNVAGYGYVCMGGPFLEDCRVLHQAVQISRMYSFDSSPKVLERQKVNKPYGFIQTHRQQSDQVVKEFSKVREALGQEDGNILVWLDYTSPKERRRQLQELQGLLPNIGNGDVVRITLNAHRNTLGDNSNCDILPAGRKPPTLSAFWLDKLTEQLGEHLPDDRKNVEYFETNQGFCQTLMRTVKHSTLEAIKARRELMAFPLLSTAYSDGQWMITVTFILINTAEREQFCELIRWADWPHQPGENWDKFVEIDAPTLSLRERYAIHAGLQPEKQFQHSAKPSFLSDKELAQYETHYLRYPTFAPLDIS